MKNKLTDETMIRVNQIARGSLASAFVEFIRSQDMSETELQWFLDPRNRDDYETSFGRWLQRPREFASND